MKKILLIIFSAMFSFSSLFLFSCSEKTVAKTDKITKLTPNQTYTAKTQLVGSLTPDPIGFVVQGSCFVNGELYSAVLYHAEDGSERARIFVTDIEGSVLRVSEEMDLQHANCLTYVEKENVIFVAACQPTYNGYYKINPQTLTIVEQGTLEQPFFAMAYDSKSDRYASGRWSGQTLDVWDGELNHVAYRDVETNVSTSQGVFCNETELYFVRWKPNEILRYDWEMNFLGRVYLTFDMDVEPEDINVLNGKTYITCNLSGILLIYEITEFSLAEK